MTYHQEVFLPAWEKLEPTLCQWGDVDIEVHPHSPKMYPTMVWHHDELTYYANNWHKIQWVHQGESAVLYAKGDRVSLMVADFVSANYRWLKSQARSQQAQVLFKAGKAWEGYFMNKDISSKP